MGSRSTVFGREPRINTIIGGVAGSISSKSALATKLAISESIIKRFEIVGSDVHANISSSYYLPANVFNGDLTINSYLDLQGKCYNTGALAFNNSSVSNIVLPNITELQTNFASNTANLTNLTVNNLTTLHGSCISFSNFTNIDLSKVVSILGTLTLTSTKLTSINLPLLVTIPTATQCFRGNSELITFNAPNLEYIGVKNSFFLGLTKATLISMPKLKTFGDSSLISSAFTSIKTNCVIKVNIALATANSGAADAALTWAKNNRAAVVEFYDDNGNYVSTL